MITEKHPFSWDECDNQTRWYLFVIASIITFFGGIIVILTYRIIYQICRRCGVWRCLYQSGCHAHKEQGHTFEDYRISQLRPLSLPSIGTRNSALSDQIFGETLTRPDKVRRAFGSIPHLIHTNAIRLVSYQRLTGRFFIGLSMLFSLCSFGIYAVEVISRPTEVEKCGHKGRFLRRFDFAMNLFFLVHFIARLIATSDALVFWVDWFSILDFLTVPPVMLEFILNRTWLGFRFIRIFRLYHLSEILHNMNLVKSPSTLRLVQLITIFTSLWLSGAGMVHLLENPPSLSNRTDTTVTYPASLYFTLVTMSTVGYGDIVPTNLVSRMFVCLFILFALATFAAVIPELVDTFFTFRKYSGSYVKPEDRKHIVVCGDITTDSVRNFLSDFLHEDRKYSDVEVVFINQSKPDLQLQSILRMHFSRAKYFQGTVMNQDDLARVRLRQADACLILASSTASDPSQKDAANIMRVIAVKNYASHVRVIVQLLQTENKSHLLNSPYWNWDGGDEVICFSELKLGFLAQSCNAMGFSTLLTNLFSMRSLKGVRHMSTDILTCSDYVQPEEDSDDDGLSSSPAHHISPNLGAINVAMRQPGGNRRSSLHNFFHDISKSVLQHGRDSMLDSSLPFIRVSHPQPDGSPSNLTVAGPSSSAPAEAFQNATNWLSNYLHGITMEIYSAVFSNSFIGLSFAEAAVVCRKYLDISLIAVVARAPNRDLKRTRFSMNELEPSRGLNSPEDDQEPSFYLAVSPSLSENIQITPRTLGFFICDSQVNADRVTFYCKHCHQLPTSSQLKQMPPCLCNKKRVVPTTQTRSECSPCCRAGAQSPSPQPSVDRPADGSTSEDGSLEPGDPSLPRRPRIHCLREEDEGESPPELDVSGMYYYCKPRSFEESLLTRTAATTSPGNWHSDKFVNHILLCLLAEPDSPQLGLHSFVAPLRASNIPKRQLRSIVMLGSENYLRQEWPNLVNFPDVYCLPGSPLSPKDLRTARIRFCSVCVVLGARGQTYTDDSYMLDKEVILCSLNIRAMNFPPLPEDSQPGQVGYRCQGDEVPLITELRTDANITYLDLDDIQQSSPSLPESLTAPFARGVVFTSSVLDILASTAYFDRNAMTLIRHLVTGGVTPALEKWFAEGAGLNGFSSDGLHETQSGVNDGPQELTERDREILERRLACRKRPRVALRSVEEDCFRTQKGQSPKTFRALFCRAIETRGILCLGLYRKEYKPTKSRQSVPPHRPGTSVNIDSTANCRSELKQRFPRRLSTSAQPVEQVLRDYTLRFQDQWSQQCLTECSRSEVNQGPFDEARQENIHAFLSMSNSLTDRYVITSPPNYLHLLPTDLIFCLCPFESDLDT